ncbi:alpha-1,2-fucosyltransferase [Synechococcus sp. PROS-9-1]|uniref:alpha-1,2-fucosyltransferase n=1 Tax=Synechococcus sp. PROS-9-1 TaxID=1968775 RepID=UPI001644B84A|nr:alpha-1,2-fucosyltransferase [Synechococcus sp. PROS-9-1]
MEDLSSDGFHVFIRRGLFFNLYVPDNVFFQHSNVFCNFIDVPPLKRTLLTDANLWLSANGLDPIVDTLVFVHIRRGDYLRWPSLQSPAVLSLSWYLKAIEVITKYSPKSTFIFMGDDLMYLEDIFGSRPDSFISQNSPQIDLMLMSLCHHGILSASSFAWWGAKYCSLYHDLDPFCLAPKYWIGHRSQQWYPPFMETPNLTYL